MSVTHQPAVPTLMAVTVAHVTMDTVEMEPNASTLTNAALQSVTVMPYVIIQMVVTLVPATVDSPVMAALILAVTTLTSAQQTQTTAMPRQIALTLTVASLACVTLVSLATG